MKTADNHNPDTTPLLDQWKQIKVRYNKTIKEEHRITMKYHITSNVIIFNLLKGATIWSNNDKTIQIQYLKGQTTIKYRIRTYRYISSKDKRQNKFRFSVLTQFIAKLVITPKSGWTDGGGLTRLYCISNRRLPWNCFVSGFVLSFVFTTDVSVCPDTIFYCRLERRTILFWQV
jgi:hypothetical protein